MKIITLLLFMAFLPLLSKAQGVFGSTHHDVADTMRVYGFRFSKTDKNKEGRTFDLFEKEDGTNVACYYNSNDFCCEYRRIMYVSNLIETIEHLNKTYIRVDDNNWINKEATIKIYYDAPNPGEKIYYISFTSMRYEDK
jgi:hypothetical protein